MAAESRHKDRFAAGRKASRKTSQIALDRRLFVVSLAATAFTAGSPRRADAADNLLQEILSQLTGGAAIEDGGIRFDLPAQAENGLMVSYTVSAASPTPAGDDIEAIHIVSTANKTPLIATFRFTPRSGKAEVASRMRLAKTQEVLAIAKTRSGRFFAARKRIDVTVGSCG